MVEEWRNGLCVGNTYFDHRNLHKYKRLTRGQYGVEVKSMTDLVLLKKDMLRYVEDVRVVKGWDKASYITILYCVKSG